MHNIPLSGTLIYILCHLLYHQKQPDKILSEIKDNLNQSLLVLTGAAGSVSERTGGIVFGKARLHSVRF